MIKHVFTASVVAVTTLVLIVLCEMAARFFVEPLVTERIGGYTRHVQPVGTLAADDAPEWAGSLACSTTPQAVVLGRYMPERPAALGTGLPTRYFGSYYSPLALKNFRPQPTAFNPEHATGIVAVFGGSTIAGDGLPCSEFSVPSQIQRRLLATPPSLHSWLGNAPRVDNMGESASTAYGSLLELVNLVRYGYRPDIVLLNIGQLDAYHTTLLAVPHFNYAGYAIGATGSYGLRYSLRDSLLSRSALLRLLTGKKPVINGHVIEGDDYLPSLYTGTFSQLTAPDNVRRRAAIAAADMVTQVRFATALGEQYGFRTIAMIAPSVTDKKRPSAVEKATISRMEQYAPFLRVALQATIDNLERGLRGLDVIDLRGCLGDSETNHFRDVSHMTPRGYEKLSECIVASIGELAERATAGSGRAGGAVH